MLTLSALFSLFMVLHECRLSAKSAMMCKLLCLDRFSAEGTPFTMDSEGVVRMMNTSLATTWMQVANTRDQVSLNSDRSW